MCSMLVRCVHACRTGAESNFWFIDGKRFSVLHSIPFHILCSTFRLSSQFLLFFCLLLRPASPISCSAWLRRVVRGIRYTTTKKMQKKSNFFFKNEDTRPISVVGLSFGFWRIGIETIWRVRPCGISHTIYLLASFRSRFRFDNVVSSWDGNNADRVFVWKNVGLCEVCVVERRTSERSIVDGIICDKILDNLPLGAIEHEAWVALASVHGAEFAHNSHARIDKRGESDTAMR